ncbi:MAG: hypothetical protein IPH62_16435 [Ignavibacteriae bacterium]|nr:hypothetical protein [Ignavibacteriota bacterium]
MKKLFVLVFSILSLFNCTSQKKETKIIVGMTYVEVENILGKPQSINRGATELDINTDNIPYEILLNYNSDTIYPNIKYERWYVPKEIKTVGNLIYVAWIYNENKIDTAYVVINKYKDQRDTTYSTKRIYYLDDKPVTKEMYDRNDGYLYLGPDGDIISKSQYQSYKLVKTSGLLPPRRTIKTYKDGTIPNISGKKVFDKTEKIFYEITNIKTILFDASSGRVTNEGYFPVYVRKIYRNNNEKL